MILSERAKNWLVGPKALITAAAIIGLVGWGGIGLVVGGVAGFLATVLIGIVVRSTSGGMIPPKARRELAERVASRHPEIVSAAYPDVPETEWVDRLEEDAEAIIEKAVDRAPSNEEVWMEGNVLRAATEVTAEQATEEDRALFGCIGREIAKDWYEHS